MKNSKSLRPNQRKTSILRQLIELIPTHLVAKLAREHGVDKHARTFTPWSHVVALLYAQLAHALSLNDVCDALKLWTTPLRALRGATPPSRNNLSHANKTRDCAMPKPCSGRSCAIWNTPSLALAGDAPMGWRTASGARFTSWTPP